MPTTTSPLTTPRSGFVQPLFRLAIRILEVVNSDGCTFFEHQFEKLNDIFSEHKKGRFKVGPGRPIPMPDFNEPQPDMILFKTEAGTRRQHASPQEIYLVIEVSDTTVKYDSEKKLLAYENARIPEYWIVDVPAKAIRVFRLNQGKRYQETRYTEGSIAVQAFPDVSVHLEDLF